MNRILAPILLTIFLFPSFALGEEITIDDLVKREGIYYTKFSDVPFTGKVTGKSQGTFRHGKKDGPWVGYWANGQLWVKETFKDGILDGPWVLYYDNGQLLAKGDYKNGGKEGTWVSYWVNGQLMEKTNFKNGEKEGAWVRYYDNGQLNWKGTYKNGVKVD